MPTSLPNFNFLALLVSEIKRVSQNLMWGLPSRTTRTLKLLCVLPVLGKIKQPAKFQHRIFMHHAAMRICIPRRLSIICAQKWVFGGLRVKMWKYCVLTRRRHYPAWIGLPDSTFKNTGHLIPATVNQGVGPKWQDLYTGQMHACPVWPSFLNRTNRRNTGLSG